MMQASASLSERLLALLARRPVSEHDLEMTAMFTLDAIACIVGARRHPNARRILGGRRRHGPRGTPPWRAVEYP
jgi:hypothetical protein